MFLKGVKAFKTYLLFLLCAAVITAASAFYFNTSDTNKNTSTIIFNSNTDKQTSQNSKAVTSIKTSATAKSKTTTAKTIPESVTEAVTEMLYIDINSANADELAELKGIGEVLAKEIINYRENNGGFRNIEEIMNVNGIGEGIFADIRDYIYVISPVYDEENQEPEAPFTNDEYEPTEYVPTLEEAAPININTAGMEELMLLPHVDEDIALRIIDFREHTRFSSGYELILIDGLSQNDAADILTYIVT